METRNVSFRDSVRARRLAAFVACFSLRYSKKYFALFGAFVAAILSHAALAQTNLAEWRPGVVQGNTMYFGPDNATRGLRTHANAIWESAVGGGAKVSMSRELVFGATKVPVIAKAAATGAAVFGTFKAIMGGPVGIGVTALMAAPAIIDWLNQGGVRLSPSGSPKPFEASDSQVCTVAPCFNYKVQNPFNGKTTSLHPSASAACTASANQGNDQYWSYTAAGVSGNYCNLVAVRKSDGVSFQVTGNVGRSSVQPQPSSWVPASVDDIAPKMQSVPASSAVISSLLDAGGLLPIAYAPGGTTGPASVSGVPVVKTTPISAPAAASSTVTVSGNPYGLTNGSPTITGSSSSGRDVTVDGKTVSIPTTSTTTSTYNAASNSTSSTTSTSSDPHTLKTSTTTKTDLTYGDGTVTGNSNTTTTSTVTNNVTNNVVNTTTSSENKPSEQPKDEQKDPCKENPERVGCMEADTPEGKIPRHQEDITYTPQNVLGEGSCPADLTASLATLGRSVTVWDWQKTCELSLPLRAIVMSLASFAALMIVMPGAGKS